MTRGWLYDGESATRHAVTLEQDTDGVSVGHPNGRFELVPAAELIRLDERADAVVIGRTSVRGWRLGIPKPVPPELAAALPKAGRYGGWVDKLGLAPAAAVFAAVSAAVLAVGWFAPAWLTPLVPESWERSYGEALVGDFGGQFCDAPAGSAALARMARRLDRRADALNIRVVNIGMVNAAALPGGNVMLFRGLLEGAESPDEVAGVLGHEIAHVRERHVTEAMLRQFGFGLLLSTVGGSTAGNVEGVLALSYGREAEREADAGAIARLAAANISPVATARFFERLAKREGSFGRFDGPLAYLSSHPLSGAREKRFNDSAERGRAYRPALTDAEWTSLKSICGSAPPALSVSPVRPS